MTLWPALTEAPAVNRWRENGPVVRYQRYQHTDVYNRNSYNHTDRLRLAPADFLDYDSLPVCRVLFFSRQMSSPPDGLSNLSSVTLVCGNISQYD